MATGNSLGTHPAPLEEAVAVDRLLGVARAAGLVPARRGKPEEDRPVQMYCPDSESLQFVPLFRANNPAVVMRPVSAASSSACVAVAAEALATRRMSHPGSISGLMRRKIVLNRRRTLLRTTADPRRLPVEMPNLV